VANAWQGIRLMGPQNLIRHCQIEHAHYGLSLSSGSHQNMIADNVLWANGDNQGPVGGAIVGTGNHNRILRNQIEDSPFGILLVQSSGNIIAGNEFLYLGGVGIRLQGLGGSWATNNMVAGNRLAHVGGEGLSLANQSNLTIADNKLYRTAEASTLSNIVPDLGSMPQIRALPRAGAITFQNCRHVIVSGNQITESGWGKALAYRAGVYVSGCRHLAFDSNQVHDNRGHGLEYAADNDGQVTIRNNAVWNNSALGLANLCPATLDVSGNWWGTNSPRLGVDFAGRLLIAPWIRMHLEMQTSTLSSLDAIQLKTCVELQDGVGHRAPDGMEVEIETELGYRSAALVTTSSGIATVCSTIPLTTGIIMATARAGTVAETSMLQLNRPWEQVHDLAVLARN
jgi:parallel beta-helix repeat protein